MNHATNLVMNNGDMQPGFELNACLSWVTLVLGFNMFGDRWFKGVDRRLGDPKSSSSKASDGISSKLPCCLVTVVKL